MKKEDVKYGAYVQILKEELVPAMGCTEPIALAYAAAKAREILGSIPDKVVIEASGSIIKNVKSVIVPNTNHLKGIPAAATAGIIAGRAEKELEVIAQVTESEIEQMKQFLQTADIKVVHADNGITFDIIVSVYKGSSYAKVRIANYHTNIVLMEKNGEVLYEIAVEGEKEEGLTDRNLLNMKDIWDFAMTVDVKDIKETLDRQIAYNTAIAEEGLRGDYGANIGSVLLDTYGDTLYRALALSNLVTIHQKTGIGRLSAYCGAVSAGAGAGAGIAYLCGGGYEEVIHTVVNALAIVSGIVCDGAKASCAAKIASAVDAGILGYNMYKRGQQFYGGDGIVTRGVEETIQNVGRLGKQGMKETNEEIIKIMVGE